MSNLTFNRGQVKSGNIFKPILLRKKHVFLAPDFLRIPIIPFVFSCRTSRNYTPKNDAISFSLYSAIKTLKIDISKFSMCKVHTWVTDLSTLLFQTPHPISRQVQIGVKDTLKSLQSSDLDPNFRLGRLVLSWFGLPTQTNSRKVGRLSLF